jgi:hypothetical protein
MAAELVDQDELASALAVLGDHGVSEAMAAAQVADLLLARERVDEAVAVLRDCANEAESAAERDRAADSLRFVLAEYDRSDELRTLAEAGDAMAAERLVGLLLDKGRTTSLRARVSSGGTFVSDRIVRLLLDRHDTELAKAAVRDHPERVSWVVAEPLVENMAREGRTERVISLLGTFAEKETNPAHRQSAVRRLIDVHLQRRDVAAAVATYRAHPGCVSKFDAPRLIKRFLEHDRAADAALVLRDFPQAADSYTAACLVDLIVAGHGTVEDALSILRQRVTDRRAAQRLADLQAHPDRVEVIRAPADAAGALVDQMLAAGKVDDVLAVLRERAAGGDHLAAQRLTDLQRERAADRWLRLVDRLMNAMYELRVGRNLARPYSIAEWERGRVPDPEGDADARLAAALRQAGVAQSIPGGDLPRPAAYTWNYNESRYERLHNPRYHWEIRDDHGIGGFFEATVSDDSDVTFSLPSGTGRHGSYPATPEGWRSLMADVEAWRWPGREIRLFVSPYADEI